MSFLIHQKDLKCPNHIASDSTAMAAGFLLYSGAWESINSVQQNAPGRSTVVNISHHHHFPKQQLL
jgi:hypothetical protein